MACARPLQKAEMSRGIVILYSVVLFSLCHCPIAMAASLSGSHLSWGNLAAWETSLPDPPPPALSRVLDVAKQSLDIKVQPIPQFHLAGTLNKDPAHQESDRAKQNFPQIFDLAVCARLAPEPLRGQCLTKASSALLAWANIYQPSGNPVDDSFFAPLLQGVDLIASKVNANDRKKLLDWARSFAKAGDRFYDKAAPARGYAPKINNIRFNNFMSWHLYMRALSGTICQDQPSLQETRSLLADFLNHTFVAGANGVLDGTTYDFVQRDSLHYHIYDLEALVWMSLLTPSVLNQSARSRVELGLNFIKTFYTGEREHVEFQHSVSDFDFKRINEDKNNPTFQMKSWDPKEARGLFLIARQVFPDIRSWTTNVVDERYDPSMKLLANLLN